MKPINVVIYTPGYDTGGQGIRLKQAFDKYYPEQFSVHSIHTTESYFGFPKDVQHSAAVSYELFAKADVIHMRNGLENLKRLRPNTDGVGVVCHWHGTRFREEHERLWPIVAETGAIQLVSTIDLMLLEPNLRWLPSPMDLEMLRARRRAAPPKTSQRIRVMHAPTNRLVKSTAAVLQAIQTLANDDIPVELDLVEKQPWSTVLDRKAKADIYVDQLRLGYGNNALEAWAMGIPVIAGVDSYAVMAEMFKKVGELPFFETTELDLARRIEALATDDGLRAHWGLIGLDYVNRFHSDHVVVDQLAATYWEALEMSRGVLSHG